VSAARDDRDVSAQVVVPATGDPPPLCLDPPCAALPAALVVTVGDTDGVLRTDAELDWRVAPAAGGEDADDEDEWTSQAEWVIADLKPGAEVHLRASLGPRQASTVVWAGLGVSEVVLTLPVASEADDEAEDENGP
jgi:hypothetical protein